MADAVDAHEAAQAPPRSKASGPPSMPAVSIEDTLTEPATTPRVSEVPVFAMGSRTSTSHVGVWSKRGTREVCFKAHPQ